MIDWDESAELNGMDVEELKTYFKKFPSSTKKIIRICDDCEEERELSFDNYSPLCFKCVMKTQKVRNAMSRAAIRYNKNNPEAAKDRGKILKRRYKDNPDIGKSQSEHMKEVCSDLVYRKSQSEKTVQYHINHPEVDKLHSEFMKKRCNDPEWRKYQSGKLKQYNIDNPEAAERRSAFNQGMNRFWVVIDII